MKKEYVYNGDEVVSTGRIATRILPSGKKETLVEVTPTDHIVGTWKKWVGINDLFAITENQNDQ